MCFQVTKLLWVATKDTGDPRHETTLSGAGMMGVEELKRNVSFLVKVNQRQESPLR